MLIIVLRFKAGSDFLIQRGVWQHVACELLDGELIEREISIEGLNHPLPVLPHRPQRIALVAVAVGISCQIQPMPCPALTIVTRGEESLQQLLISIRILVGDKRIDLFDRRRKANQIQAHSPDQPGPVCFWRGLKAFFLQAGKNEQVDRVASPRLVLHFWKRGSNGRDIGPVLLLRFGGGYEILRPGSTIVNPAANEADLFIGQRVASHRHPLAFDLSTDHLDEQALGALSWKDHFAGEPSPATGF
jgi:hypothetical protein